MCWPYIYTYINWGGGANSLELLVLIDNLNAMLVVLGAARRIADGSKMAVHGREGRSKSKSKSKFPLS